MKNEKLTRIFAALADPTRRTILEQLGADELTTHELARPFGLTMPTISLHLSVLEDAGLITRTGPSHWRLFRLESEPRPESTDHFDNVLRGLHEKEAQTDIPAERLTLT